MSNKQIILFILTSQSRKNFFQYQLVRSQELHSGPSHI